MTVSDDDKAILFLLKPDFLDAKYPGERFFCPHCARIEGVLASFPELAARIDVRRVDFPRPRAAVIELAGEVNQGLPLLVLSKDQALAHISGESNGRKLVAGADQIISALVELYGIPKPHP
jgi:hypothetical protein